MKRAAYLAFAIVLLAACPAWPGEDSKDFLFLQVQRELREQPFSDKTSARQLAIAEYFFFSQSFNEARQALEKVTGDPAASTTALLRNVYLAKIDELTQASGPEAEALKETLANQPYFSAFGKKDKRSWKSPLGNRYEFKETVNTLEIRLNGSSFYTIRLA